MRYAYNTVVRWNKNHIKPQTLNVKEGKDPDEKDKDRVWGECKFL